MRKLICPLLAGLLLLLLIQAGRLTSDWGALLACAPAALVMIAAVVGLVAGVFYFRVDEPGRAAIPLPSARTETGRGPGERTAPAPRLAFNEQKIKGVLVGIRELPQKYTRKETRPREVAQVVDASCTGCGICVPFCPVGCIEVAPTQRWPNRALPPARIRYDECVGCAICVSVCATLAWDATVMRPAEAVEREEGIVIHGSFDGAADGVSSAF